MSTRAYARFAGAMFLIAMVASICGGLLIQGVIDSSPGLHDLSAGAWPILVGVSLELVNALAVIGIAAAMWVPLTQRNPAMTVGYLGLRVIEAALCVAAAFIPVTMLTLADRTRGGTISEREGLLLVDLLTAICVAILEHGVPIVLGAGAMILYVLLFRTSLVPKYIAVWGLIGSLSVIVANTLLAGSAVAAFMVLPILTNEIYLGLYLLVKGFRAAEPNRQAAPA